MHGQQNIKKNAYRRRFMQEFLVLHLRHIL